MIRYVSEDHGDNMEEHVEQFILKRRLSDGHLLHHLDTFHVALVVCSDNNIYDHKIYSRQLLPAKFDENQSSLAFIPDKNGKCLLTYEKRFSKDIADIVEELPGIPEEIIEEHMFSGVDEYGISVYGFLLTDQENGLFKEIHIPMYSYANILLSPSIKATIEVDAHLAGCIFCEMNRSRRFRKRFLNYVRRQNCFKRCSDVKDLCEEIHDLAAALDLPCLIEIHLVWPKQKIDYAWDYRICGEVEKRVNLEENMAWLNTLGGGYGALGDYFTHHALKAGQIALKQLRISQELGDQISAAKCRLFLAQSLLQCGYLRQCKYIVRDQYRFACRHRVRDEKLEAMCHSLWNRLKYLRSLHRNNKLIKHPVVTPCLKPDVVSMCNV